MDAQPSTPRQRSGDASGREAFTRLAELASRLTGAQAGQVVLVDSAQTVIGGSGLAAQSVGMFLEDTLCAMTARENSPLVVPDAARDDRVARKRSVVEGAVGAYLGVPLARSGQDALGALSVYDAAPHPWEDADVVVLQHLATSVMFELDRAALAQQHDADRAGWELTADAAGVGAFDFDIVSGRLSWDDRLVALFGYDRKEFDETFASFERRVHPDDLNMVRGRLQHTVDVGGDLRAEFRIVLPGGALRWVTARGRAVVDVAGRTTRVLGAAFDTTAHVKRADSNARVVHALEAMSVAFCSVDPAWRFTYVNARAEQVLGSGRHDLLGRPFWDLFPASAGADVEAIYRRAMVAQEVVTFEALFPAPLDAWFELTVDGNADGLAVYFTDVTDRHRAEEAAELSSRRLAALGEVALALLDAAEVTDLVTIIAEQGLAALGCDGGAVAVPDPADAAVLLSYITTSYGPGSQEAYGRLDLATELPVCVAARTGHRVLVADREQALAFSPLMAAVIEATGSQAFASIPLQARGRLVGVLTAGWDAPQKFEAEQLEVLEAFAAQCAQALDRMLARDAEREANRLAARFSETLQRSLLGDPATPEGLEVAVRYLPATAEAKIGGDWYDTFVGADGVTSIVIGDVTGHDRHAAAAMGQLRNLLRGIGYSVTGTPAEILALLDRAVHDLAVDASATVVLAHVGRPPGPEDHDSRTLEWSSAGHLPPLVIERDGTTRYLQDEPNLLIGLAPDTGRRNHSTVLPSGATLLLYTDGLIERRRVPLDVGFGWLARLAGTLAQQPLDVFCDAILAAVTERIEDDVALLALRAAPGDQGAPEGL